MFTTKLSNERKNKIWEKIFMKNKNIKNFNGERLKSARIYRGFSVSELAEKLDLQRQTISMYETGEIENPAQYIIKKMSEILDFPEEFFKQNDNSNLKYGSIYFRSLLTTEKKYRNQQEEKIKIIAQIYEFLNEYLTFPRLNLPDRTEKDIRENYEIEELAMTLRDYWKLGLKPIDNIVYLAEQNGITVISFESDSNAVDAFSKIINDSKETYYFIGYSRNKNTAARIHFDIAHELGHILMHEWSEDIEAISKETFREREQQAHNFASALLLPKETFKSDLLRLNPTSLLSYQELKKKWKVSMGAMIRRAYNLELMTSSDYQLLNRQMQKYGMKKQEPFDDIMITAVPSLLSTAITMIIEANVLTSAELIRDLSLNIALNPHEIEQLLVLPNGILDNKDRIPMHELEFKIYRPDENGSEEIEI